MKNYNVQSPYLFHTTQEEIKSQGIAWGYGKNIFNENLNQIRRVFGDKGLDVVDFTIRLVPEKRNSYDSAKLLCLKTRSGEYLAKRHNNSQYLYLEY